MRKNKILRAAGTVLLVTGTALAAFSVTAEASSTGCAFSDGCATLHGTDAAGNLVAMDAKYQNSHEIIIGYPDNVGDNATSWDAVVHFGHGTPSAAWADTSLQANLLHSTCTTPAGLTGVTSGAGKTLTITAPAGESLANSVLATTPASGVATAAATAASIVVSGTGTGTGTITFLVSNGGCADLQQISFSLAGGVFTNAAFGAVTKDTAGGLSTSYPVGGVQFTDASPGVTPGTFTYQGLPSGVVNNPAGLLTVSGSTAPAGTYSSVGITYTDADGAAVTYAFQLVVDGTRNVTVAPGTMFYTFVYAPHGDWTSQCATDIGGSGALRLEPCTLGRDTGQDFLALNAAGNPSVLGDGSYHIQDLLYSRINAGSSCLTDPSTLPPGTPQSDATDEAGPPNPGRQLRVDGSCTSSQNEWTWAT